MSVAKLDKSADEPGDAPAAGSPLESVLPTLPPEDLLPDDAAQWPTLAAAYGARDQSLVGTLATSDLRIDDSATPAPEPAPSGDTPASGAAGTSDATAALQRPAPSPAPAQPRALPGQLIGKYRIGKELGRGGMGAVFVAVHETIGQRAAVKILFPQFAKMRGCEDRFFYEARMANLVKHPGLVQVFDHGHLPDGTSYILMEFLDGQSLQARLSDGEPRGERRPRTALPELLNVLRIGRQIALILHSVHEKGIVHRDLKPGNILLCPDPIAPSGERVKLIDFGIAKIQVSSDVLSTNEAAPQTRMGSVLGTPKYMSPEQCQGQSNLDGKADVYALGVILYEMLSGQAPFHSPQTGTLLAMHIFKEPPALRSVEPSVPGELAALVHRMLAKSADVLGCAQLGCAVSTRSNFKMI